MTGWLHEHYDNNTNFSPNDFAAVWGKDGWSKTYLADKNNDVSYLTKEYVNDKWDSAKMSSKHLARLGLRGMQAAYPEGLPGVIIK